MSDSAVADAPALTGPPAEPSLPSAKALPLVVSAPLAAGSGALLALAFPGASIWPLAYLCVAGLALATRGARARRGALLGFLFGLGFFAPHIHWTGIYVGAFPWLALAVTEALYLAAMGAALPRAWRIYDRNSARGQKARGTVAFVFAMTGLWVLQEAIRGSMPFGGFPWGRLAFSQASSPVAGLAAIGGAPLMTAAVAASGTLLALAISHGIALAARMDTTPRRPAAYLAAAIVVLVMGMMVPRPAGGQATPASSGTRTSLRVAAVQGNVPQAGLDFNAQRRAVLDNHSKATLALAAKIKAGTAQQPDLVIWPENSSDIDPLRNPDAYQEIDTAADEVGVPIVVGAVLNDGSGTLQNASIVWSPGTGPASSYYVKQHPAPFAEYIPYRSFFRHFSSKVDLVREDFRKGKGVGLQNVDGLKLGDVICFEVAYDGLVRDSVKAGANLIAVQTNNATFGYSDESVQQLAMSRIRAIESGRSVVHISTVGISAIIRPDGSIVQQSGHFTQQTLQAQIPLRTTQTIATRVGAWPERILAGLGVILVALAGAATARRPRRARRAGRTQTDVAA